MAQLGLPVSVPPPLLKIEVAGIAPVLGSQAGPIDPAGPWSPAFRASIVASRRRVNFAAQHPGAANWAWVQSGAGCKHTELGQERIQEAETQTQRETEGKEEAEKSRDKPEPGRQ